ncbi:DUF1648 domain-containing protein [Marinococcus sp. PL1-022]|uniref:DUF1648 domain-containing protein n=1 Tax=Marinococcus sp. PL1-022 TaxID=3095363 RepID=UPI0029C285E2|nr:DUF1648 domain-containing protein [Marinococcus sp. PL1-022]MDX6151786.1 DUF1648 domain-containing protein [Marinococcus sp. PL1-022]
MPTFARTALIVGGVASIGMLAIVLFYWPRLPYIVPQFFDATGDPNEYAAKYYLFVPPLALVAIWIGAYFSLRYPGWFRLPVRMNEYQIEVFKREGQILISVLLVELSLGFVYVQWQTVRTALNESEGLGWFFPSFFLICLIGTAVYFTWRTIILWGKASNQRSSS